MDFQINQMGEQWTHITLFHTCQIKKSYCIKISIGTFCVEEAGGFRRDSECETAEAEEGETCDRMYV